MLVNPGLDPPWQTGCVHLAEPGSLLVFSVEAKSLGLQSKTFPMLLTGCSVMEGIVSPASENWNLSTTFPLLSTRDLDFAGLKFPGDELL